MRSRNAVLEARVRRARTDFTVDVALELAAGDAVAIFGRSGSGKSTVLSCLAGLETPDDGFVRVAGAVHFPPSLPLHRRGVGYLTQDAALFPHLTVGGNVAFGLARPRTDDPWLAELRDRMGLRSIWKAPAAGISGGEARRAALARVLAVRPRLLLLDEPFAGLDAVAVRLLLSDLAEWRARLGFAAVIVDHDARRAAGVATRAIVLEAGRVVQRGTWAELAAAPATEDLRDLLAPR